MEKFEERYREKLFYEAELSYLNRQCNLSRNLGSAQDFHEWVMTLYDYLIEPVRRVIEKEVTIMLFGMRRELKEVKKLLVLEESVRRKLNLEEKRNAIIRRYTKAIYRTIIIQLDKKNLMLKRKDIMLGYEEKGVKRDMAKQDYVLPINKPKKKRGRPKKAKDSD